MRNSEQRNQIVDYLNKRTHPSGSEIYEELHKTNDKIGLATVYRNLKQLESNKIIKKIITPNNQCHYDIDMTNHYHFICRECNKIIDLEEKIFLGINQDLLKEKNLLNNGHDLILYGECESCQNKKKEGLN